MDSFFDKIKKQLKRMTEAEKDAWILSQAKILPDFKQEDFYKSICGTKKVINEFYDPDNAMNFVSSVIRGCHDLVVLEEFEAAFEILDEVLGLEFTIEDHPDTDDRCEDEFMDLEMAVHEGLISINRDELLKDYILACRNTVNDIKQAAMKIVSAFERALFKDCKINYCIAITEKDPLLTEIKKKLTEDLNQYEEKLAEKTSMLGAHIVTKNKSDI